MNWFYDTFLPSLLERAGTNKGMWLSRKQTAICIEKMEKHTTMVAQFQGDYYRHNYYTLEWSGRKVFLNYSKLNGCGQITFGFTPAEAEDAGRRHAEEKRIRRYRAKIADLQEALEDILADLAESESEGWIHGIECERNALERTRKEIAEAETMLAIYL